MDRCALTLGINMKCLCFLLTLSMASCSSGDSSDGDPSNDFSDREGIYNVTAFTINEKSCESEGESVLDAYTEKMMFFRKVDFFGVQLLSGYSCPDEDTCQFRSDQVANGEYGFAAGYSFSVESGSKSSGYKGGKTSTGFANEDVCTEGTVSVVTMTVPGDGQLSIREEITMADDHPKDAEGFCTTDGTKMAVKGKSCGELRVLALSLRE